MSEPVAISGIWVRRQFDHLGGNLEILVEYEGRWRLIQEHPGPFQGMISHITEPAGIRSAPPGAPDA